MSCPRRSLLAGLMALGLLMVTGGPALAASCCGGASITDQFTVPKWERWMAGASLQFEHAFDMRLASGERVQADSWRNDETRLLLGGAYRLGKDWQAAAVLPLTHRRVTRGGETGNGFGPGDLSLQLRYEIMDEETCFLLPFRELTWDELKPSIHWVATVNTPTGRPTHRSLDSLGASVTGSGYWTVETGPQITKIWGAWGNSVDLQVGYQTFGGPEHGHHHPDALRWRVGGSLLYYPAYQQYIGVHMGHRREIPLGAEDITGVEQTTLSLIGSYRHKGDGIWLRGSLGSAGLVQGRNAPVSLTGQVTVAWAFR